MSDTIGLVGSAHGKPLHHKGPGKASNLRYYYLKVGGLTMKKTVHLLESVLDIPASWHLVTPSCPDNSGKEHGHVS